jgi:hypothetical protein
MFVLKNPFKNCKKECNLYKRMLEDAEDPLQDILCYSERLDVEFALYRIEIE